jgi:hypothetical protein
VSDIISKAYPVEIQPKPITAPSSGNLLPSPQELWTEQDFTTFQFNVDGSMGSLTNTVEKAVAASRPIGNFPSQEEQVSPKFLSIGRNTRLTSFIVWMEPNEFC